MAERENVTDLEFKWGQKIGVDCLQKEAQFYKSFTYDGTQYTLYDCVYLFEEGVPEPYIGKLIGIWETVDKTKEVDVQWFFRPVEILNWLGDQTPMPKEIFLATGEGIGLSNVIPLEAIAGKCCVVCTSEDIRNRQPSEEETKMADYIFYRTFDVGLCTILDKMEDSVGGLEVKYVFNREDGKNVSDLQTYGSSKVEVVSDTVACKGKNKHLIPNSSDELKLLETCENRDNSVVIKDVSAKSEWVRGESSDYKSGNNTNVLVVTNKKTQAHASGQSVKSSEVHSMVDGVKKAGYNKLRAKEKLSSDALQDKRAKKARICNSTKPCEDKISNLAKNSLVQADNSTMHAFTCKDKTKSDGKDLGLNKGVSVAKNGGILKNRPTGNSNDKPSNPAKKIVTFKDTNEKDFIKSNNYAGRTSKLNVTFKDRNAKDFIKSDNHAGSTSKLMKDSVLKSTSKERINENTRKLSSTYATKIENREEIENRGREQKVSQRSDVDIIDDSFQTNCVAIRIPRTRISSPHSGEALIMLTNVEIAKRVFRKLSEGCLMLPNGRPLVATKAPPIHFTEGQHAYFGHLVIDSIKLQRNARDAVSTSHCSQPNTIEYTMAMEWCLLQAQFDRIWEGLYKHHKEDMRRLKRNLKLK
ncbi:protein ANTI-SILENCING 1 isoform X3 [Daucus carota subsp. sativus]|uniref:protein ANTI-SILENCING 1 isoform X3 n=1 Tax=Daucus carota subsp. sativus TaxID=79200 RepID=UPI0007EF35CF|nr:PREDICTED: uncharacterized protein LOC108205985 isoform X3 [Daucus carota subsp. sativus]